jgi:hypothetical protein
LVIRGQEVAVSGFPYERRQIRERFPRILEETGWRGKKADLRLLCIHHCVEGATVGPANYTFRGNRDVIRCEDLPHEFAAVLSGHIHRHQILRRDLNGRPLRTPVLYPGSVERTAFAEMDEEKGFLILEVVPNDLGGHLVRHDFSKLPARPMVVRDLAPETGVGTPWTPAGLIAQLDKTLSGVPKDSVLQVRVHGPVPSAARSAVGASSLRKLAPPEMNLEVSLSEDQDARRAARASQASRRKASTPGSPSKKGDPGQQWLDL